MLNSYHQFKKFYENEYMRKTEIIGHLRGYDKARTLALIKWCAEVIEILDSVDPETFTYDSFRKEYGYFTFMSEEEWDKTRVYTVKDLDSFLQSLDVSKIKEIPF